MLAVLVAVVAAAGLSLWANTTAYTPVVSGRGYEAALSAAAAVDAAGIPYKLSPPDSLEVPVNQLGAARSAIAKETDLPGLGEVSQLQLGLTPQAQQWAFLRAAEGDLARMLNGIDGIVASQVHVVPHEESLYIGEQRPASAAVFVQLAPGMELTPGKVRAIVNLVANSIEGLEPERVSVADDRGNLLASGDGGPGDGGALGTMSTLVDYRTSLENRIERQVSQALLPVLGYGGGFSVTATVDLDLTSRETTTRQVDAAKQAVVSEVNEETLTSAGTKQGGVPGVDANLPERGTPSAGASTESNRTANTVNYAYPTVDEVATRPAGGVQRVSVAVQVDEKRLASLVEGSAGKIEPEALKKQIDAAVQAAVGFQAARNDVVTVSYLPFATPEWTVGTDAPMVPGTVVNDALPYAVAVLALALVFWFVVRPIVGAVVRPLEPEPAEVVALVDGEVLTEKQESDADIANRLKALVDNFQPVDQEELNRLVDREAETAADVLRKWARVK